MRSADTTAPLLLLGRDDGTAALFRREHSRLVAYARLLVDDLQTAEDVVQDAFTGLYHHWAGLADEHAALKYLRVAVLNGSRSQLRRRRTVRAWRPARQPDAQSAEHVALHQDDCRRMVAELLLLPQRQREVLLLRYYLDLSEAQIADELSISRGSVKTHASRGLSTLGARVGAVT